MNDQVVVNYHSKFLNRSAPKNMHIADSFISDDSNTKQTQPNYLFYKISDIDDVITDYSVIAPIQQEVIGWPMSKYRGYTLTVWYKGYTTSIELNEVKEKEEVEGE
jgi:hypothetical protein